MIGTGVLVDTIRGRRGAPSARWFDEHPEWWALAISLAAWIAIMASGLSIGLPPLCASLGFGAIGTSLSYLAASDPLLTLPSAWLGWLVMASAMMVPLVLGPIRHVAFRSYRQRRHRSIAVFLCGYLLVWALAGAVIVPLVLMARVLDSSAGVYSAAAMLGLAAAWNVTSFKRRTLRLCHRTVPLAPSGWRADAACLGYGASVGTRCVVNCWALMTAPVVAGHNLLVMACTQSIAFTERYAREPRAYLGAVILAACALAIVLAR